jgi:hypothetical protein
MNRPMRRPVRGATRGFRRPSRGNRGVFAVLLVAMALALGMVGLNAGRPHAAATAATPAKMEQPANPEPARSAPQPKPANNRNG